MRTFVIGDIHGAAKALDQCLERADFDRENDELICLGDVCDGWPETRRCVETLMGLKNLVLVQGNHDLMALEWAVEGRLDDVWLNQGGEQTRQSYPDGMPESHIRFLSEAPYYHVRENKLFVHAGILPGKPLREQGPDIFLWNRELFYDSLSAKQRDEPVIYPGFDEIYIGHTPIHHYGWLEPVLSGNVWYMDTGAAWQGTLSMLEIHTKEKVVSDPVMDMYPPGSGRF